MFLKNHHITPSIILKLLPVSSATAHRWCKNNEMPDLAKELLLLKLDGKVIPETKEWRDFRFCKDHLLWSNTDFHFNGAELDQMHYIHNRSISLNSHNNDLMEYIDYLESVKPRAPVVRFPINRIRPSITTGKNNNYLFNKPKDS